MTQDREYRCLGCRDYTVTRDFDVSRISTKCPVCDSFERLINAAVVEQYRSFEESPPEGLDWERLDRAEKLAVSEQVARRGRSVEDFYIEE